MPAAEPVRPEATPDLVAALARASGMPLSRERCEAMVPFLSGLLDGCARLATVDLEGVEPVFPPHAPDG